MEVVLFDPDNMGRDYAMLRVQERLGMFIDKSDTGLRAKYLAAVWEAVR